MMFVYRPSVPVAGGPKLPVKVAVLPFKDGTEDFTKQGSAFDAESLKFNLAKTGIAGIINPLLPETMGLISPRTWRLRELFRAVQFVYSPSESVDEDFYIEGTVNPPTPPVAGLRPRKSSLGSVPWNVDNKPAWEKEVTRELLSRKSDFDGCGTSMQCMERLFDWGCPC